MEQRITGREIILFIIRFNLSDAYLENVCTATDGSFELRAPGYGYDECSYVLHANGDYLVEAWLPDEKNEYDEAGVWQQVDIGNVFKGEW